MDRRRREMRLSYTPILLTRTNRTWFDQLAEKMSGHVQQTSTEWVSKLEQRVCEWQSVWEPQRPICCCETHKCCKPVSFQPGSVKQANLPILCPVALCRFTDQPSGKVNMHCCGLNETTGKHVWKFLKEGWDEWAIARWITISHSPHILAIHFPY